MITKLQEAIESLEKESILYTNLIDSDFHKNGFSPDPEPLIVGSGDYFRHRKYTPNSRGSLQAREAIHRYYAAQGLSADPAKILLTASSSEAYSLLFTHIADPGDRILLPLPGYPLFEELVAYAGLEPDFYPLNSDNGWQPDLEVLEALIQPHTRFLVLISPNNPTGSVLTPGILESLGKICCQWNLMIIVDEVFRPYIQEGSFQLGPLLEADHPGLFVINGISKLCASPDLKLSWIWEVGVPEILSDRLELANDTYLNSNSLTQHLLPELLRQATDPQGVTTHIARVLEKNHQTLIQLENSEAGKILGLRTGVGTPVNIGPQNGEPDNGDRTGSITEDRSEAKTPAGGIHRTLLLPWLAPGDDEELAVYLLREHGVLVHPGYLYGIDEIGAVVMSLLKNPGDFESGLEKLVHGLEVWRQGQH